MWIFYADTLNIPIYLSRVFHITCTLQLIVSDFTLPLWNYIPRIAVIESRHRERNTFL